MPKKQQYTSVNAYLAAQPPSSRKVLEQVRAAIRKAVPDAEETLSYNMPTYKLDGVRLLYIAAWKNHFSLYAATKSVVAEFKDDLKKYEIEKGTIRFPFAQGAPTRLIERVARFRANEVRKEKP